MKAEFLSLETAKKIARIRQNEKLNNDYEQLIRNFDLEVNKLFAIIKNCYEYVNASENIDREHINKLLTPAFTLGSISNA